MVSVRLLHLTFAAETAVFLVACLAFLASFAALLIHREQVTVMPAIPCFLVSVTLRAPQDQEQNALFPVYTL